MRLQRIAVPAAAVGLLAGTPAVAHHQFDTEYDARNEVKFNGVVKQLAWANVTQILSVRLLRIGAQFDF